MKKILLGTSALIAAGLIAGPALASEKIKLELGGYMLQEVGYAKQDHYYQRMNSANYMHTDQKSEAEIHFKGSTKLDNGLKIGVQVELEANSDFVANPTNGTNGAGGSPSDFIDESYMTIDGGFGQLILGTTNNAAYKMHVSAPDVAPMNMGLQESTVGPVSYIVKNSNVSFLATTKSSTDQDAEKVIYFTPRLYGFQLGASYTPTFDSSFLVNGSTPTTGGANQEDNRLQPNALGAGSMHSGIAAGVNFNEKFGDIGVQASAGYFQAKGGSNSSITLGGASYNIDPIWEGTAGLNLSYAGITIGGAYRRMHESVAGYQGNSSGGATSLTKGESIGVAGTAWDAGISYVTGPYSVSLTTLQSKTAGSPTVTGQNGSANQDRVGVYALAGKYNLGPGVDLAGSIFDVSYKDEIANTATTSNSNSGYGATVGLALTF